MIQNYYAVDDGDYVREKDGPDGRDGDLDLDLGLAQKVSKDHVFY